MGEEEPGSQGGGRIATSISTATHTASTATPRRHGPSRPHRPPAARRTHTKTTRMHSIHSAGQQAAYACRSRGGGRDVTIHYPAPPAPPHKRTGVGPPRPAGYVPPPPTTGEGRGRQDRSRPCRGAAAPHSRVTRRHDWGAHDARWGCDAAFYRRRGAPAAWRNPPAPSPPSLRLPPRPTPRRSPTARGTGTACTARRLAQRACVHPSPTTSLPPPPPQLISPTPSRPPYLPPHTPDHPLSRLTTPALPHLPHPPPPPPLHQHTCDATRW